MATHSDTRRPGRPSAERSADVRSALIAAALECIVELGFAGASTKHIAARAGVNPAMINYYFGGKAALGEATFRETIEPLRLRFDELAATQLHGDDTFAFLRAYMSTLAAHPWIPRLIVREVLPQNGQFREIFFREIAGRGVAILPKAIIAAQKEGRIAASLDPIFAAISMVSLAVFPFLAAGILNPRLGIDFTDEALFEKFADHTFCVLGNGLSQLREQV